VNTCPFGPGLFRTFVLAPEAIAWFDKHRANLHDAPRTPFTDRTIIQ